MRWIKKKKPEKRLPNDGDKRTVWRFLFIPKTIGEQTRWLEFAKIMQRYRYTPAEYENGASIFGDPAMCGYESYWSDIKWVDKLEQ